MTGRRVTGLPFVDPAYRAFTEAVTGFRAPDDTDAAVAQMRRMRGGPPPVDDLYPAPHWTVSEHVTGDGVPVLLARPGSTEPVPVLIAFHGGGLISGSAAHALRETAHLVHGRAPLAVAAVGYGSAPETGFGDAVQQGVEGIRWIGRHAAALGLDPARAVVVGPSAGGAVAAAAVLTRRVTMHGVLLSAPMLDDRSSSWSMRAFAGTGTWDVGWNARGWAAARRHGTAAAAPARIADLTPLSRVFLDVGSSDPMLAEVTAFADRLWQSGSDAEVHVWSGVPHGFDLAVPAAAVSLQAQAARRSWLARTLERAPAWNGA